jgi:hypothetical protein
VPVVVNAHLLEPKVCQTDRPFALYTYRSYRMPIADKNLKIILAPHQVAWLASRHVALSGRQLTYKNANYRPGVELPYKK